MNFFKRYLHEVLIIINFVLLIIVYAFIGYKHFYKADKTEEIIIENTNEPIIEVSPINEKMYVDLKGAVKKPGVYEVTDKTIINEVINMAGGFNNNAYTKNINLSKKLTNETVIYVYTQYEYSLLNKKEEPVNTCVCPEVDLSACINNGSSVITNNDKNNSTSNDSVKEEIEVKDDFEALININTATKEELMRLNGIGEAKAQNIIDYRNEHGNFLLIEDIKNVSGISDLMYEKIKEFITV